MRVSLRDPRRTWPIAGVATAVAAAAAAAAVLLAFPRPLPAKEHTAACAELASVVTRLQAALGVVMYQRHRGSSLGAYQVLRTTTLTLAHDAEQGGCGALGSAFSRALRRADQSPTALEATVEMDLGLESALALAMNGTPPARTSPPKLPPVPEAAVYGEACPDLFAVVKRLEGPSATLPARVNAALADLQRSTAGTGADHCPRVRRLLEEARPAREGADGKLAHAVDSLRLDEPDEIAADEDNPAVRCPELPLVLARLSAAISVGAPLYNAGDADGCRRTYEATARTLSSDVIGTGRCPVVRGLLAAGLSGAESARNASDAAWALRHSFDAVIEGGTPAGTGDAGPE